MNIKDIIGDHLDLLQKIVKDEKFQNLISEVIDELVDCVSLRKGIFLCGNGGSASDSQHIATELISRMHKERRAFNAEALTVNASTITAIGNDYSFDRVFARQIEAKAKEGDALIALSTSGNSQSIIEAVDMANSLGVLTIGLTGADQNCELSKRCQYCINVPSDSTPRVQEVHILIGHIICEILEEKIIAKEK